MQALLVIARPRTALEDAAARPRLGPGAATVVAAGVAAAAVELLATALVSGGATGVILSALLPALFVLYWLLAGWLVDTGAGLVGRSGRRADFLAVSAPTFVPLIAYALISLLEALVTRSGWAGVAGALGWLSLPVLAWFIGLTVLAIRAVYTIPVLNAFALALLPYAAISAALLLAAIVLTALHGTGAG